jgi:hypothetical protein
VEPLFHRPRAAARRTRRPRPRTSGRHDPRPGPGPGVHLHTTLLTTGTKPNGNASTGRAAWRGRSPGAGRRWSERMASRRLRLAAPCFPRCSPARHRDPAIDRSQRVRGIRRANLSRTSPLRNVHPRGQGCLRDDADTARQKGARIKGRWGNENATGQDNYH